MNWIIMALATGGFSGKIGRAPGTCGSLAAVLPWLFIKDLPPSLYALVLAAVFILGFFVAGSAEKILDQPDAGCIVIDEFLGMFITLFAAPPHPLAWGLGFLSFVSSISANPFRFPGLTKKSTAASAL